MLVRSQYITIACFIALFLVLHFGCDTKSKEHKAVEKSRAQNFEHVSIQRVINEAQDKLPVNAKTALMQMQEQLARADSDSAKVNLHKSMASLWFANEEPLISGHHAEQIAQIEKSAESWNIAGTTYSIAAQRSDDDLQRQHAQKKSRAALENAISMDSENIDSKINLALSYVESEAPMRGIMMLKDLNTEHPENIPVLMQLGKLSIRSGQMDKAVERLTKVIELRPTFKEAHCLLAEVYTRKGDTELASKEKAFCDKK